MRPKPPTVALYVSGHGFGHAVRCAELIDEDRPEGPVVDCSGGEVAARVILEAPNRHASFLVDWARAFLRRRAEESRARRAPQHA